MRFVIDMRSSQDGIGGIPEYTAMVAYTCAVMAPEHDFILYYSGTNVTLPSWTGEFANVSVYHHNSPNKLTNARLYLYQQPKIDQLVRTRMREPIDAWFFPNLNFLSLSSSQRMVITMHDVSFARYPEFFSRRQRWWHKAVDPHVLLSRAQQVIAVSEYTKNDLINDFHIPESKITVTHLGVNPAFYANLSEDTKSIDVPGRMILSYAGGDPRKNVEAVIRGYYLLRDSVSSTSDVELHIVGRPGAWKDKIIRTIPRRYASALHFHHDLTREETAGLMRRASLFVYPSFYEGFGLPLLEAMASGTPVITSPSSAIIETAQDGAYYTDPYNPYAMMRSMDALLINRVLRTTLQAKGIARVNTYSWNNTAAKTLRVLEQTALTPLAI